MSEDEKNKKRKTGVSLEKRHFEWIERQRKRAEGQGLEFNFSKWVRERIDKVLEKDEKKEG